MTKDITLTVSSGNLIDAVLQSDEFGKAVQTVVREEMANDILEILVSEADIFSSDEFKDSVIDIVDYKIDRKIEREVERFNFHDIIRDEMPSLTDLENEVEGLKETLNDFTYADTESLRRITNLEAHLEEREKELLIAFKGLKDLNAEIKTCQRDQLNLFCNFWSLIKKLREVWVIGRFFYWEKP